MGIYYCMMYMGVLHVSVGSQEVDEADKTSKLVSNEHIPLHIVVFM